MSDKMPDEIYARYYFAQGDGLVLGLTNNEDVAAKRYVRADLSPGAGDVDDSKTITMRVPEDKLERIDWAAKEMGLSRSEFLLRCAIGEAKKSGDVGEALEALSMLRTFTNIDDADCVGPLISQIRAALTAQSVNGQMLEALKLAEDTLAGYSPLTTQIASNTSKIRFLKGPIRTAIAAAEKAQGE